VARHEISGPTTAPPYSYAEKVDLSGHMLHLTPRVLPGQRVVAAGLHAAALPSRISEGADHIGNAARWLFLDRPHDRFQVTLEAEIDVAFPAPPPAGAIPPWEQVAEAAGRGGLPAWRDAEFAFASPMAPADPAAGAYAAASFPPGRPVLAGLLELTRRINPDFAFKPSETTLHTPVSQVLTSRAGVCQDFTRLMIAGPRALGLPARYVSGYLRTTPPPGGAALRGADQSHALGRRLDGARGRLGRPRPDQQPDRPYRSRRARLRPRLRRHQPDPRRDPRRRRPQRRSRRRSGADLS
jgi:transglutaminase-like putative cysteine protease